MGSWNETCAISGLPILCGEPAVAVVLEQGKQNLGRVSCYVDDFWFPKLLPMFGEYEDYGQFLLNEEISEAEIVAANKDALKENDFPSSLEDFLYNIDERHGKSGAPWIRLLVRADIWNSMLKMKTYSFHGAPRTGLESRQDVQEAMKIMAQDDSASGNLWWVRSVDGYHKNTLLMMLTKNSGKIDVNEIARSLYRQGKLSPVILERYSDLYVIQEIMDSLRKNWHPTCGAGSQGENFETCMSFYKIAQSVAAKKYLERTDEDYKLLLASFLDKGLDEADQTYFDELNKADRPGLKALAEIFNK